VILSPNYKNYKIGQFRVRKFSNGKSQQKRHFQMSRNTER